MDTNIWMPYINVVLSISGKTGSRLYNKKQLLLFIALKNATGKIVNVFISLTYISI